MAQSLQERYDDAMFEFTQENYDGAIERLEAILREEPEHFDARLSLGMAWCRKGDFAKAIEEGHRAETLRPHEQLVHTNLSLFYMRAGDKKTAEHHGLQARIASWRGNMDKPASDAPEEEPELRMAGAPKPPVRKVPAPSEFPDMPWKRKAPAPSATESGKGQEGGAA
ncbi:MAG: tetratricopeptide repeat protein [Verrucomicrobiae bacterium]|nr:tetratricopeptide repeat protein [Verrucomicrobiae bacterium]